MPNGSARQQLRTQIAVLRASRNAADEAEVAAIDEAIDALDGRIDAMLEEDMDNFAGSVNDALADLEAVRTRYALDAASALGRVIDNLRTAADAG